MEVVYMSEKPFVTFDQAQAAIKAMSDQAIQSPDLPVAMTIVDDAGNLVAYIQININVVSAPINKTGCNIRSFIGFPIF